VNKEYVGSRESVAACIVGAVFSIAFTLLLCLGTICQSSYIVLLLLVALFTLGLHGFSRLRELDFRSGKMTLAEVERVRDEVFAKAATLRDLAINLAVIAETLATDRIPQIMGYPAPIADIYKREEARADTRDKVVELLRATGVDEQRTLQVAHNFNKAIVAKLEPLLCNLVQWAAEERMLEESGRIHQETMVLLDRGSARKSPEVEAANEKKRAHDVLWKETRANCSRTELRARLRASNYSLSDLERYVRGLGVWTPRMADDLGSFEAFIKRIRIEITPDLLAPHGDQVIATTIESPK
jgi:hypothetical protein